MQNLFQWDQAAFDFRPGPLMERKVVIEEASLTGLKFGAPLNAPDKATFYGGGAKGYTDYPVLGDSLQAAQ